MGNIKFEDLLTESLYKTFKSTLEQISRSTPELQYKLDLEVNNFLVYLHKKTGKIQYYLSLESPTEPKIFKATTPNFVFTFTIFENKSSEFSIEVIQKYNRLYPPDYLLSKNKPYTGFVYFLKSEYGYKIGCTINLTKRIRTFDVKLPFKVTLHSFVETKKFCEVEALLHNLLSHKCLNDSEWFSLADGDFIEIDKILGNMKLKRQING